MICSTDIFHVFRVSAIPINRSTLRSMKISFLLFRPSQFLLAVHWFIICDHMACMEFSTYQTTPKNINIIHIEKYRKKKEKYKRKRKEKSKEKYILV